jgi:hypothetical protein
MNKLLIDCLPATNWSRVIGSGVAENGEKKNLLFSTAKIRKGRATVNVAGASEQPGLFKLFTRGS